MGSKKERQEREERFEAIRRANDLERFKAEEAEKLRQEEVELNKSKCPKGCSEFPCEHTFYNADGNPIRFDSSAIYQDFSRHPGNTQDDWKGWGTPVWRDPNPSSSPSWFGGKINFFACPRCQSQDVYQAPRTVASGSIGFDFEEIDKFSIINRPVQKMMWICKKCGEIAVQYQRERNNLEKERDFYSSQESKGFETAFVIGIGGVITFFLLIFLILS